MSRCGERGGRGGQGGRRKLWHTGWRPVRTLITAPPPRAHRHTPGTPGWPDAAAVGRDRDETVTGRRVTKDRVVAVAHLAGPAGAPTCVARAA